MTRRYVEQFRDGDSLDDVYLVTDKQLRANRNGNLYVQMELRDRTGGMSARMWNAGDAVFRSFDNGDFVHADGKVQNFQGSLQIVLNHVEKVESQKIDLTDFMPHTEHNVGKLLERLRDFLTRLASPHLRALAECFLMDDAFMRGLSTCPAGVKLHHAYVGGLLEHTVTMMDIADRLVAFYPGTDRDLVLMGAFLHDAGKVKELTYARTFGYSDEGQLVGHITIGVEMLNEKMPGVEELTGEGLPAGTADPPEAHDPQPPRHAGVRQPEDPDDAGSDALARDRHDGHADAHGVARAEGRPQQPDGVDAVQRDAATPVLQGRAERRPVRGHAGQLRLRLPGLKGRFL